MFVRDRKVIVRRSVGRINLSRAFPAVDRFPPQAALCNRDPELNLLLGVVACVSCERHRRKRQQQGDNRGGCAHSGVGPHYSHSLSCGASALRFKSLGKFSNPCTTVVAEFGRSTERRFAVSVTFPFVSRRLPVANSKVAAYNS